MKDGVRAPVTVLGRNRLTFRSTCARWIEPRSRRHSYPRKCLLSSISGAKLRIHTSPLDLAGLMEGPLISRDEHPLA